MLDELLERFDLKYEQLSSVERETLLSWMDALNRNQLTTDKIQQYINVMRDAVDQELVNEPEFNYLFIFRVPNRKQILLKARLRNYMLLQAFLLTPEKAKAALERALEGLSKPKGA